MTIRSWCDPQCAAVGQKEIHGSFIPNGSSAIATTYGVGFSVAWTSTGVWTVTLEEGFADFLNIQLTGQWATADTRDHFLRVGGISVANKTFAIVHRDSADASATAPALANIATSGTANKIHFVVTVAQQDVPGAGV
jgi:hypothetical protein